MRAVVTVIGKDRTGIIFNVSKILAENNVNIEDISQTVMHDFFTMIMLVDLSGMRLSIDQIKARLDTLSQQLDVSIKLQREDIFNSMHRM